MRHMSSQLHLKPGHTKVAELPVVQDKVCISQLNHIHRVVQYNRVGRLHKPVDRSHWIHGDMCVIVLNYPWTLLVWVKAIFVMSYEYDPT